MSQLMVVHEDGNPFVRTQQFESRDALLQMMRRTHNRLLDNGYAVSRPQEKGAQRVVTYRYVKSHKKEMKDVHVVVIDG
jgi:hypothetical protein